MATLNNLINKQTITTNKYVLRFLGYMGENIKKKTAFSFKLALNFLL